VKNRIAPAIRIDLENGALAIRSASPSCPVKPAIAALHQAGVWIRTIAVAPSKCVQGRQRDLCGQVGNGGEQDRSGR